MPGSAVAAQTSTRRYIRWKIHEVQRKEHLARFILVHMLQDFDKWTIFMNREQTAVDVLCYFALIEGLEEEMLKWLDITTSGHDHYWRMNIFTSMCKARDLIDTGGCADKSLETFFTITDRMANEQAESATIMASGTPQGSSAILKVNPRPALLMLFGKLTLHLALFGKYRTNETLFDRFASHFGISKIESRRKGPEAAA